MGSFFVLILVMAIVAAFVHDANKAPKKAPVHTVDNNYHEVFIPAPDVHNCLVYHGSTLNLEELGIENILLKHQPYYRKLAPELQVRFATRVRSFIQRKHFIIHSDGGYKEMPVLTSAAAVQLTFGLNKYQLPHFEYIRIHIEEYFADNSLRVLAGHVQGNTITLAWNQFLKDFATEHNGVNVGLHEMAHALYFQHAVADMVKPKAFITHFNEIMEEGAEVYELRKESNELYSSYAYTNLQEFWAESVEIFFERPEDMTRCFPEIYETLKELLNQDPLNAYWPLVEA